MKQSDTPQPHYHSYLLRLWRDGTRKQWCASLQSTQTEQVVHFAHFEALCAYLSEQLADGTPEATAPRQPSAAPQCAE